MSNKPIIDNFMISTYGMTSFCYLVVGGLMALLFAYSGMAGSVPSMASLQKQVQQVALASTAATVALVSDGGETGSGVIVSPQGLILTAAHVVGGDEMMRVVFADGRVVKGRVLGANFTRDAAMVQIMGGGTYPYVELGESDALHVGDFVVALGHSKGFDPERRAPIRMGRLCTDGRQRFLISECTLIGGDSGGPLFDLSGKLVGIHSSIGPMLKINNHVPVSVFRKDWDKLLSGRHWGQLGLHPMADPESAVLGFAMMDVLGVDGVVVEDVVVNSPADEAGIRPGDVITHMDNRGLRSMRDMLRELGRHRPGETVPVVVLRKGTAYKANLTFGRRGDLMSGLKQTEQTQG